MSLDTLSSYPIPGLVVLGVEPVSFRCSSAELMQFCTKMIGNTEEYKNALLKFGIGQRHSNPSADSRRAGWKRGLLACYFVIANWGGMSPAP